MTGERLAWFRLAYELKQPLQRLQKETTSSEFRDWMVFFNIQAEEKQKSYTREEYFYAQIALEVFNAFREKRVGTIEDFLIELKEKKPETKRSRKKIQQDKMNASKAAWLGAVMAMKKRPLPPNIKQKA